MTSINVNVKCSNDTNFKVSIPNPDETTILELKQIISETPQCPPNTPPDAQRLIYAGKVLKDHETVSSYGIKADVTIHLVRSNANRQAAAATSASSSGATSASTAATGAPGAANTATTATTTPAPGQPQLPALPLLNPFNMGALGSDPFGLGGAAGAGAGGGPHIPPHMQQMLSDPAAMQQMMNNPMMQSTMQMMMSNPQMMDMIIAQYPELAAIYTPEMRAMMQNPAIMQMIMGNAFGGPGLGAGALGQLNQQPNAAAANPFASFGVAPPTNATGAPRQPGVNVPHPMAGIFGAPAAANAATPAAPAGPVVPPEERFQEQLALLNDMGFFDPQANIRALLMTGGNVNAAVEFLLSQRR